MVSLSGIRKATTAAGALALAALVSGCATTGGSSQQDMVAATYRKVSNLESNLSPQVEKLNTTATELNARVEETDRQTRALQSSIEEQQVKLDQLEGKLDDLMNTLYRQLNLSPPSSQSRVSPTTPQSVFVPEDKVVIEPGPGAAEQPADEAEPELGGPNLSTPEPEAAAPPAAETGPSAVELYRKAYDDYDAKRFDVALQGFTQYLEQHKNSDLSARAQYWKSDCYFNLGQYDKAISEFEQLRRDYPDSDRVPYSLYRQADAHLRLKQRERAKQLLTQLVEQYPTTVPAERAAPALRQMQETN